MSHADADVDKSSTSTSRFQEHHEFFEDPMFPY
jgi:hypothetical protein